MNLGVSLGLFRSVGFRAALAMRQFLPPKTIEAFGSGEDRIGAILAINLDRQPRRWQHLKQELGRFLTHDGRRLSDLADRMPAIDARDGRETAPTADVDPIYTMGDQLFVQPDARLEECFGRDEPIRMTRQEIAVARSHVEAWKRIARGPDEYVLVLEDDAYFVGGAARIIDRGWRAALHGRTIGEGPQLLYFSYLDAGGTAERTDLSDDLFRPIRGYWYLSGYVLSRSGAASLLRMMPVVGPVDLWINHRFMDLRVAALSQPALLQRSDAGSDNAYSIVPYLSRSGIVDAGPSPIIPASTGSGLVLAWNGPNDTDALGMALSTLGYRVRTFSKDAPPADLARLVDPEGLFDAYVDADLEEAAIEELLRCRPDAKFVLGASVQEGTHPTTQCDRLRRILPPVRTAVVPVDALDTNPWEPLSQLLGLQVPDHVFPRGASRTLGLFSAEGLQAVRDICTPEPRKIDESPWVLPATAWQRQRNLSTFESFPRRFSPPQTTDFSAQPEAFRPLTETFPGNMATFEPRGISYGTEGATLALRMAPRGVRPMTSGAIASRDSFTYGRFEADIRSARGGGLITGFFLHRDLPRQEIDVELLGSRPNTMLVNVYFNPGDDGTAMSYGYRGTPHEIDLGFDASADFHTYAVEWTPAGIQWLVDGCVVHVRANWAPTPIPHLPMRLHANLWSPRSEELAGQLQHEALPAQSTFRRVVVRNWDGGKEAIGDSPSQVEPRLHGARQPTQ